MVIFRENGRRIFKIWKFDLKPSKNESRKFNIFKQIYMENRIAICHCLPSLCDIILNYFQTQVTLHSIIHKMEKNLPISILFFLYKCTDNMRTHVIR